MTSAQGLRKQNSQKQENSGIRMSGTSFQIVDQYQDMIYRTALTLVGNAEDAEDILQEVFFKYFRLSPAFESESHEKAWFLRVTINEGKNLLKSFWKRRRTDFDFEKIPQPESHDPGQNQDSEVLQAVLALPEKYRIAIYLYYYEEYSIREIAGVTEQSETAVAQHLSRGRMKLRKKLEGLAHGSA
ncbi:MAG: sigma-70 family RNA polymerase sigma factor [Oscillospiraceae bacterium]|nr:sigma-70 family RNA polymerase sigma factor [Oscillospiraceae bacterium]